MRLTHRIVDLERGWARRFNDDIQQVRAMTFLMMSDRHLRRMAEALATDHSLGRPITKQLQAVQRRMAIVQAKQQDHELHSGQS